MSGPEAPGGNGGGDSVVLFDGVHLLSCVCQGCLDKAEERAAQLEQFDAEGQDESASVIVQNFSPSPQQPLTSNGLGPVGVPVSSYRPPVDSSDLSAFAAGLTQGSTLAGNTISYSFLGPGSTGWWSQDTAAIGPYSWSSTEKAQIRLALEQISGVANLNFVETSDNNMGATFTFEHFYYNSGLVGVAGFPDMTPYGLPGFEGAVGLNTRFLGNEMALGQGGFGFSVTLHELGHALGLKHTHDNGGTGAPTFPQLGFQAYDKQAYTVMSYNDPYPASSGYAGELGLLDIYTLHQLYGARAANTGDDVYRSQNYQQTIWDTGGIDTIDMSNGIGLSIYEGTVIDLREGALSYGTSDHSTVAQFGIAFGAVVENAIGTTNADTIFGNASNNILDGGENNGAYSDRLVGGAGDDTYIVDAGTNGQLDRVEENAGEGFDTVLTDAAAYIADDNVEAVTYTGTGNTDLSIGSGNLVGGTGHDILSVTGSTALASNLTGGAGRDTALIGRARGDFTITSDSSGSDLTAAGGVQISLTGIEGRAFLDNSLFGSLGLGALNPTLTDSDGDGRGDTQIADIDNDGDGDWLYHGADNDFWVALGNGGGFDAAVQILDFGGTTVTGGAHLIDVTGTAALDLVFVDASNNVWVSENGSDWSFGPHATSAPVNTGTATASASISERPDGASDEGTAIHTATGSFTFSDANLIDGHIATVTPQGAGYRGTLTANVSNAAEGDGAGAVSWSFSVDDATLADLDTGDVLTQTYEVAVNDVNGATAMQTVTVTINGADDAGENAAPRIELGTNSGAFYFTGDDGATGIELYRIDDSGTITRLTDLNPGLKDGVIGRDFGIVEHDGGLYFAGINADASSGLDNSWNYELQRLDLSSGTVSLVADLSALVGALPDGTPAADGGYPGNFATFDGELYFTANANGFGQELYKLASDGTVSLVADFYPGEPGSSPTGLTEFNGALYFSASNGSVGDELYRLDSNGDISLVADIALGSKSSVINSLTEFNGSLYFGARNSANISSVYRLDPDGEVVNVSQTGPGANVYIRSFFTEFSGELYFGGRESSFGTEVYKVGANGVISLVADLRSGSNGSNPHDFVELDGSLYFRATDDTPEQKIFRIDLNGDVSEFAALPTADDTANAYGGELSAFNGELYVRGAYNTELYKVGTDGTVTLVTSSIEVQHLFGAFGGNGLEFATSEDTPLSLTSISLSDPDAGTNPLTVDVSVGNGDLAFNSTTGLTFTDADGSDGTLSFSGTLASLNAAFAAGLVYTPEQSFAGSDSLTIAVDDGAGGTATTTEAITVNGVDDGPMVGVADSAAAVTEVADNAPGENSVTHSVSGAIAFTDADTAASHAVSVTAQGAGYRGTLTASVTDVATSDGAGSVTWSFAVDDADLDNLGAGDMLTQLYDVVVADGNGGTVTQIVTVTLNGTDDKPVIGAGTTSGTVTELAEGDVGENTVLHTLTGTIAYNDADVNDSNQWSYVEPLDHRGAFNLSASSTPGSGAGILTWSYQVSDADLDDLGASETLLLPYQVSVGGSAWQTVTVTLTGAADDGDNGNNYPQVGVADLSGAAAELGDGAAGENATTHTDSGTIAFSDINLTDSHTVGVVQQGGGFGGALTAAISDAATGDGSGQVTWDYSIADSALDRLGDGRTVKEYFKVTVDDGNGGTVESTVEITLTGTNDGVVIGSADLGASIAEIADGAAGENATTHTEIGVIAFADADHTDAHSVTVTPQGGSYRGTFTASVTDSASGDGAGEVTWSYSVADSALEDLTTGDVLTQTYDIVIDDGNGASVTRTVTIDITGSNDVPTIDFSFGVQELYFGADGNGLGHELYKMSADGTVSLAADIDPGSGYGSPSGMTEFNGALYFNALDGVTGNELYRLTGDGAVTRLGDMWTYPGSEFGGTGGASGFTELNGSLYFRAFADGLWDELFRVTSAGDVELVADINPGAGRGVPLRLTKFDDAIYFSANDGINGTELHRVNADGSVEFVKDIVPGGAGPSFTEMAVLGDSLYFGGRVGAEGRELYRYDTDGSVTLVADVRAGSSDSTPTDLVGFNGSLYFEATDDGANRELFRYDSGAGSVTKIVLVPGDDSQPKGFTEIDGSLYFATNRGIYRINGDHTIEHLLETSIAGASATFEAFNGSIYVGASAYMYRIGPDDTVTQVSIPGLSVRASQYLETFSGSGGQASTNEDTALAITGITLADPDAGSGGLSVTLAVTNGALTLNQTTGLAFTDSFGGDGTLAFSGTIAALNAAFAAGLVYDPDADFYGTDGLTLTVDDGDGGTATATETITVVSDGLDEAPASGAPIIATADQDGAVAEIADGATGSGTATISDSGVITFNDIAAGAVHSVAVTPRDSGYRGTMAVVISDSATGDGTGAVTWTYSVGDAALDDLDEGETRAELFTVTIEDGNGVIAPITVTVTITGSNEAPVLQSDVFTTASGKAFTGNLFDDNGNGVDSDPNGDALTLTSIGIAPTALGGIVTLVSNGDFAYIPPDTLTGADSFSYTVEDSYGAASTVTVSVTVTSADEIIIGNMDDDLLIGGSGNDMIDGGSGNDTLFGDDNSFITPVAAFDGTNASTVDGDDTLHGRDGNDQLYGGGGRDTLFGDSGLDLLAGGDGDDHLYGGDGGDTLDGGEGIDTANYFFATGDVTGYLRFGGGTGGEAAGDSYRDIENLAGSNTGNDWLEGDSAANTIWGNGGNDVLHGWNGGDLLIGGDGDDHLYGGADADVLDGGAGIDTANYFFATGDVVADLSGNIGSGGDAAGDTYWGIENVAGSDSGNDWLIGTNLVNTLWGNGGNDVLWGLGGDDLLIGGTGNDHLYGGLGADILDGGDGIDTANYFFASGDVWAHLGINLGLAGEAVGDTYWGIENVAGSDAGNDTLEGNSGANTIGEMAATTFCGAGRVTIF